jgi:SNF2 family DNA or RNA helicase
MKITRLGISSFEISYFNGVQAFHFSHSSEMLLNTITIVPETPKVIKARNNENISPVVNNRKSMESDKKSPYFRSSNTIPTKSALIRSDQTISKPENGGVDYGEMTILSGKRNPIEISSDESENESQDDPIDKRVTEFLNSSNLQDLQEYLKCSKDQALLIIGNRNYKHFDDVEDIQLRKMILKYREIIGQFDAVDNVIHHCDKVGREIEKVMLAWSEICAGDNTNIENLEFHCLTTQPKEINSNFRLKQYQLTGISWMLMLYSKKIGGILADEMGLGKSAQVIGFLSILTTRNSDNKYLIIVPSSTLENWMREIEQWSCNLKAICYTGSMKQRMELQYDIMEDSSVDVVLTTYNTATGNSVDRRFLRRMGFECLILDEGHMIKNDNSARSIHLSAFQIPFKMLITGTPIQNNLVELLTLLTFINPELFTSAQISFQSIFDLKSSVDGTLENKLALNRIQKANSILSPFVLRRKKQDVRNDIPPKTRIIEYIKLLPKQRSLYHVFRPLYRK